MSLMVSLCFNWKVRRSWRASMPGMKPLTVFVVLTEQQEPS